MTSFGNDLEPATNLYLVSFLLAAALTVLLAIHTLAFAGSWRRTWLRTATLRVLAAKAVSSLLLFLLWKDADLTTGVASIWIYFAACIAYTTFMTFLVHSLLAFSAGSSLLRDRMWPESRRRVFSRVSLYSLVFITHLILRRWFSLLLFCLTILVATDFSGNAITSAKSLASHLLLIRRDSVDPRTTPSFPKLILYRNAATVGPFVFAAYTAVLAVDIFTYPTASLLAAFEGVEWALTLPLLISTLRVFNVRPLYELSQSLAPLASAHLPTSDLRGPNLNPYTPQTVLPRIPDGFLLARLGHGNHYLIPRPDFDRSTTRVLADAQNQNSPSSTSESVRMLWASKAAPPDDAPPLPVVVRMAGGSIQIGMLPIVLMMHEESMAEAATRNAEDAP